MSITQGISELKLEAVENAICLSDIDFSQVKVNIDVPIRTSIVVDGKSIPISTTGHGSTSLDVYSYNGTIKMNIPKLMPFYSVQRPYEHYYNVDKNILINSNALKPKCSNKVKVCNFIEVKMPQSYVKKQNVRFGERLQCVFPNGNITEPHLLCL